MNLVTLIGNLTRDPEFRESGSGVCKFSLAIEEGYGDNRTVTYPSIVVFGNSAKSCSAYLHKGSKVGVIGRIQTGSYEKDGRKVYTTDVIANRVEFLSRPTESTQEQQSFTPLTDDDVPF